MQKGCLPGIPVGSGTAAGAATAWVKFNGANGNIQAGYNVRSVVRNAAGDYTITFIRPFAGPHFVCVVTAQSGTNIFLIGQVHFQDAGTAGAKRVNTLQPAVGPTDPTSAFAVFYGEQ